MNIGIVLLIVLIVVSNLTSFVLGVWAFKNGVGVSFLEAKGYNIPPLKKKNPKNNKDKPKVDPVTQMYEDA